MNAMPTRYVQLNVVLIELTQRAMEILGENFVGAYLQGSFAVGDVDLYSDWDLLIPTHEPITADHEAGPRAVGGLGKGGRDNLGPAVVRTHPAGDRRPMPGLRPRRAHAPAVSSRR